MQVTSGKHGEFASTLYATASVLNAVEDVERDLKWLVDASQTIPMFQQVLYPHSLPHFLSISQLCISHAAHVLISCRLLHLSLSRSLSR